MDQQSLLEVLVTKIADRQNKKEMEELKTASCLVSSSCLCEEEMMKQLGLKVIRKINAAASFELYQEYLRLPTTASYLSPPVYPDNRDGFQYFIDVVRRSVYEKPIFTYEKLIKAIHDAVNDTLMECSIHLCTDKISDNQRKRSRSDQSEMDGNMESQNDHNPSNPKYTRY
jgi:hypothetical protein